jgi:hypothetical protein
MRSWIWAVVLSLGAVALAAGDASAQSVSRVISTTYYPVYSAYPSYTYVTPTYVYAAPTYYSGTPQRYVYAPVGSQGYSPASNYTPSYSAYSGGHPPYGWAGQPHEVDYDAWGHPVSGYELWQSHGD